MDTVNENTNLVVETALACVEVNPQASTAPEVASPPAEVAEAPAPEQAPEQASEAPAPRVKRAYNVRGDADDIRQRIRGHLTTVCVAPISVGELSVQLGIEPLLLGYHCRALAAQGVLLPQGEKRGRKYSIVLS